MSEEISDVSVAGADRGQGRSVREMKEDKLREDRSVTAFLRRRKPAL